MNEIKILLGNTGVTLGNAHGDAIWHGFQQRQLVFSIEFQ